MAITLAFDVYGTLIDTHGVVELLQGMVGDRARAFSQSWRDKQLEYTFRRGLMQHYADFSVCTRQALDYTCKAFGADLSDDQRRALLDRYRELPAFDDVPGSLRDLREAGMRMFAFSNGTPEGVEGLLEHAGILSLFDGVVSVHEQRSYKPAPGVYAHFLRQARACGAESWLVSGNPFDVIGAISAGMSGAWVRRSDEAVFDPWGVEPTVTVSSLEGLLAAVA